jgi:hypothetical protein
VKDNLTKIEKRALEEAGRCAGWGLFSPRTTARLAERGLFEKAEHPWYGQKWRMTDAGRAALLEHFQWIT